MRCVENDCCGCATESYPCRGDSCSYRHSVHLYCDKCKRDVEKIYEYEDYDLCEDCLLEEFDCVDIDKVDWQDI